LVSLRKTIKKRGKRERGRKGGEKMEVRVFRLLHKLRRSFWGVHICTLTIRCDKTKDTDRRGNVGGTRKKGERIYTEEKDPKYGRIIESRGASKSEGYGDEGTTFAGS